MAADRLEGGRVNASWIVEGDDFRCVGSTQITQIDKRAELGESALAGWLHRRQWLGLWRAPVFARLGANDPRTGTAELRVYAGGDLVKPFEVIAVTEATAAARVERGALIVDGARSAYGARHADDLAVWRAFLARAAETAGALAAAKRVRGGDLSAFFSGRRCFRGPRAGGFDATAAYAVERVVGSGASGLVVAALDAEAGELRAIKKVPRAFANLPEARRRARKRGTSTFGPSRSSYFKIAIIRLEESIRTSRP